jgi:hypothetical protein
MNLTFVITLLSRGELQYTLRNARADYKERSYCYSIRCHSMTTSFKIDRYVADVLLRDLVSHDRSPAAFVVYLFLTAQCSQVRTGKVALSLADIADRTGLSKRAVQIALAHLRRRKLIKSTQVHRTATPIHAIARPWRVR